MKPFKYLLRSWFKNFKDRRIGLEVSESELVIRELIIILKKESFFSEVKKIKFIPKKYVMSKEFLVLPS